MLKAVKINPKVLEYASEEIKDNMVIVLSAVCRSGSALEFASERLKNNEMIVLTATKILNLLFNLPPVILN